MFFACFSTAPSATTSSLAIATFERPSAISAEHLALARGEGSSGRRGGAAEQLATTSGSSTVPPAATRRTASTNSSTSATRSLSR